MKCNDCPGPAVKMNESTLKRGSTVREPGEALCLSCSAKRAKMVREVEKVPSTITDIQANKRWESIR